MSTSFPSPTTQREHSVHPAHLQARSVDKLRHQEPLWREWRKTRAQQLPRVMSPKNLRPSQESKQILEIHVNFLMHRKKLEKKKITDLITEEMEQFGEIRTAGVPDSEVSETSYIQSQMHFDDSVESIADSDLEDRELHEMLTSPLYAQKTLGKPDASFHLNSET